ncbi:MAG: hypothetical protein WCJ66_16900 [Verrucomicrobiota bacterium]
MNTEAIQNQVNTTSTALPILTEPPQVPGVRRLILSEATSKFLQSTGEHAFVIVGKLFYPATPGTWAIFLEPVPIELAHLANGVLCGTHKAVKIRQPSATKITTSPT